jgi:tetratricopeptide (TPR) repeat protein
VLLVWLLAAAQGTAVGPPHDLTGYLAVAARFGSADHSAAMGEIRSWALPEIEAAAAGLRRQGRRLRAVPEAPEDIAFRTVEAAVLLHAEAGLLALQATSDSEAQTHLRISTELLDWSHTAADKQRQRGHAIAERIDRRDFDMALAAASLSLGFPATACFFAEEARRRAPLDAEVHLMLGCAAETRSRELALARQDSEAERRRDEAERALSDTLALDPGLQEARLRLGQLLVDRGRLVQAESLLDEVEAHAAGDRQRYLARLFLGRLATARGRVDDAVGFYRRALEAWPDSQAARLALAQALEQSSGPSVAWPLVTGSLAAAGRLDRTRDPWWMYLLGPPGQAQASLSRLWSEVLGQ